MKRVSAQARLCHAFAASLGEEADPRSLADLIWLAWALRGTADEHSGDGSAPGGATDGGGDAGGAQCGSKSDPQQHGQPSDTVPGDTDSRVRLFPSTPASDATKTALMPATLVKVPAGEALPQRRSIERSLKPFMRRCASRHLRELDPVATAEASAERRAITPVFRATLERWFEIALLVELSDGMQVWEETAIELQRLLDRHGAFRRVRLWRYAVRAGSLVLSSANGAATAPRSIIDSQGRSICLFLTNGTSEEWVRAPLLTFVDQMGQRGPTAILQMMPRRTWPHTVLGDAMDNVAAQRPGTPTAALRIQDPFTADFERTADGCTVPVLTLEPRRIGNWARFAMATRTLLHPAVRLEASEPELAAAKPEDEEQVPQMSAAERLAAFRSIASPQAYQLLRLLAGAPLTLPIMRLMQMGMPGEREQVHLAEVVLSGLIERVPAPDGTRSPESAIFEFGRGIRRELLDSLSVNESLQIDRLMRPIEERTRQFVESQTGRAVKDFTALLADPEGTEHLDVSVRSFLSVSRRIFEQRHLLPDPGDKPEGVVYPAGQPRPPQSFLTEEEIRRAASTDIPISRLRTLLIFRTPRQQTWLVASHESLMFLLDDDDTRASGRLLQRRSGWLDVLPLAIGKNDARHATIGFGPEHQPRWYYSELLFPTPASLQKHVMALLPGGAKGSINQLRDLAMRYEQIRRSMQPGQARTGTMSQLVNHMRSMLPSDALDLSLAIASRSDGNKLVVVASLQAAFDRTCLDWLIRQLLEDHAFIAYNAADALQRGMDSLNAFDRQRLKIGVEHARGVLQSRGLLDGGVHEILERILVRVDGETDALAPSTPNARVVNDQGRGTSLPTSLRIHFSSTFEDFVDIRAEAFSHVRRRGHVVVESWQAAAANVLAAALDDIARCDVLVCILGTRYGFVPSDLKRNPQQRAITELEYAEAVRLGKPVIVFMHAAYESAQTSTVLPGRPLDVEAAALHRFKSELLSNHVVQQFVNADEMLTLLDKALASLQRSPPLFEDQSDVDTEPNQLRRASAEPTTVAKSPKRIFISSPSEYARYAGLLEAALQQDVRVERPTGGYASNSKNPIETTVESVDAFVVIVGTGGLRQTEAEIRLAKTSRTRIFAVLVSHGIQEAPELRGAAVANVDARSQTLALTGLHGAALTRAINSTAVNILSSMDVDLALMLHEQANTYEDDEHRYFNPAGSIRNLGRKLREGDFRVLVSQLDPDELLMGLYENQAPALVATHVNSRTRLHELSQANLKPLGFYAVPRGTANRGWGLGTSVPENAAVGNQGQLDEFEAVGAPQREPQGSDEDVKRRVPMVVVSYVRTYAALARSFVAALEATGRLDVRYDGHLSPVESFPSTVLQWVDQSDALVVLAGPASAQANYSKVELERAQNLGTPVLAVVVEAGKLPSMLASYSAVNVDDDGTLLLLARLEGRPLKTALRRVALQVVEAVAEM